MSDKPAFTARTHDRFIHVFVSSIFRYMHAESEELFKRIFPRLCRLCEEPVSLGEMEAMKLYIAITKKYHWA